MREKVICGSGGVSCISAPKGGLAEQILRRIADPGNSNPMYTRREFDGWHSVNSHEEASGTVLVRKKGREEVASERPLTLNLGSRVGLWLDDVDTRRVSLRGSGSSIPIGNRAKVTPARISDWANQIVAAWVLHGFDWQNSSGRIMPEPYGQCPRRDTSQMVAKGLHKKRTLGDLIDLGLVCPTSLGEWSSPGTIISATLGAPTLLHEFGHRHVGPNSHLFGNIAACDRDREWLGYCSWLRSGNYHIGTANLPVDLKAMLEEIASKSRNPFNFFFHSTRALFPKARLLSAYLLEKLGEDRLQEMVELIVRHHPEKFYRMIDPSGRMHLLKEVVGNDLVFHTGRRHSLNGATTNILNTFRCMAEVEDHPSAMIVGTERLVLEPGFYVVALVMLGHYLFLGEPGFHNQLVGNNQLARSNQRRNGRLYRSLNRGEVPQIVVLPPVSVEDGPGSQYSVSSNELDLEYWRNIQIS